MEDFEKEFQIEDLLNDQSLNYELAQLGWNDDIGSRPNHLKPKHQTNIKSEIPRNPFDEPINIAQFSSNPFESVDVDISNVGLIDDSNVQLTEEDFNDPDLLAQFEMLSIDHSSGESMNKNNDSALLLSPMVEPKQLHNQTIPVASTNNNVSKTFTTSTIQTQQEQNKIDDAKAMALKCKREGDEKGALAWMRKMKELSTSNSVEKESSAKLQTIKSPSTATGTSAIPGQGNQKSKPMKNEERNESLQSNGKMGSDQGAKAASVRSVVSDRVVDAFSPLEDALTEAMSIALSSAKQFEPIDKKVAIEKMKEYKYYQQELTVLRSRRQVQGAIPALFRWITTTKETTTENLDIGEDQVKLEVTGAYNLEGCLENDYAIGKSYSISINYTTEINKDNITTGTIPANNYKNGNKIIANSILPLSDIVTKSESGGILPLLAPAATHAEIGGKKSKAVGGSLHASVKVRFPLIGIEKKIIEERKLKIDPWSESDFSSIPHNISQPTNNQQPNPDTIQVIDNNTKQEDKIIIKQTQIKSNTKDSNSNENNNNNSNSNNINVVNNNKTSNNKQNILSQETEVIVPIPQGLVEADVLDPFGSNQLESNDVMESEINIIENKLANNLIFDEDELFNEQIRLQTIKIKLQILIQNVQENKIEMDDYLQNLRNRIEKDRLLANYFKELKTSEGTAIAIKIMKRMKIMKDEIKGAEENM
eukprot:gene6385-8795_t